MATTYQFLGESSGLHYTHSQGMLFRTINLATLVANPGKLALASAPNTPLSSFAFLDGSEADILQIFHCPAKTSPTRNAALRGYQIMRVPGPVTRRLPLPRMPV